MVSVFERGVSGVNRVYISRAGDLYRQSNVRCDHDKSLVEVFLVQQIK